MELIYLLGFGVLLVCYFIIKSNNQSNVKSGINRLNNDVASQRQKLSNPNRNSL